MNVWGTDLSTVRVSLGVLMPDRVVGESVALPKARNLPERQAQAAGKLTTWLGECVQMHGRPDAIGFEAPMAGSHTPLASFYLVGVWLAAVGHVLPGVPVVSFSPSEWKKAATGQGYISKFAYPVGASKDQRRTAEKQRIIDWARSIGYPGLVSDEADAVGVARALEIKLRAA